MAVGEPVVIAFVRGKAVAVHLGEEAQGVGEGEVPDGEIDGDRQSLARLRFERERPPMHPRRCVVRNLDLAMNRTEPLPLDRVELRRKVESADQRDDRVGHRPYRRGDMVKPAEFPLELRPGLEDEGRAKSGDRSFELDLKSDGFVPSGLKPESLCFRVPEVVGRPIPDRLRGNRLAGRGVDLVELIKDRDRSAADLRERRFTAKRLDRDRRERGGFEGRDGEVFPSGKAKIPGRIDRADLNRNRFGTIEPEPAQVHAHQVLATRCQRNQITSDILTVRLDEEPDCPRRATIFGRLPGEEGFACGEARWVRSQRGRREGRQSVGRAEGDSEIGSGGSI